MGTIRENPSAAADTRPLNIMLEPSVAETRSDILWHRVVEGLTRMTAATGEADLSAAIEEITLELSGAETCRFFMVDCVSNRIVFETSSCGFLHPVASAEVEALLAWLRPQPSTRLIDDPDEMDWPARILPDRGVLAGQAVLFHHQIDDRFYCVMLAIMAADQTVFDPEQLEVTISLARHAGYAVTRLVHFKLARQEMLHRTALYEVGKQISSSLDINEVLNAIIDALQTVVPYDAAGIFLLDEDQNAVVEHTTRGYSPDMNAINLEMGEGISGSAAATGKAIIVPDVSMDERYVQHHPGTKSEMAVPLLSGGQVIGVFNIENNRVNAYDEESQSLLEAFASQASIAIQNARLFDEARRSRILDRELEVAGEIQRTLLPRAVPEVPGLSLAAYSEPSREVGGDFYDFIPFSDKQLGLAVGDVVGKGIPAALTMASLYTSFHEFANYYVYLPSYVIGHVNEVLYEVTSADRFATLFYGIANMQENTFVYCNAGHPPPVLCRKSGETVNLYTGGLIVGSFEDAGFEDGRVYLNEGDVVVLYTDGLIEKSNDQDEIFGIDRLEEAIRDCHDCPVEEIRDHLIEVWRAFVGNGRQDDDTTMIVVKREH